MRSSRRREWRPAPPLGPERRLRGAVTHEVFCHVMNKCTHADASYKYFPLILDQLLEGCLLVAPCPSRGTPTWHASTYLRRWCPGGRDGPASLQLPAWVVDCLLMVSFLICDAILPLAHPLARAAATQKGPKGGLLLRAARSQPPFPGPQANHMCGMAPVRGATTQNFR